MTPETPTIHLRYGDISVALRLDGLNGKRARSLRHTAVMRVVHEMEMAQRRHAGALQLEKMTGNPVDLYRWYQHLNAVLHRVLTDVKGTGAVIGIQWVNRKRNDNVLLRPFPGASAVPSGAGEGGGPILNASLAGSSCLNPVERGGAGDDPRTTSTLREVM